MIMATGKQCSKTRLGIIGKYKRKYKYINYRSVSYTKFGNRRKISNFEFDLVIVFQSLADNEQIESFAFPVSYFHTDNCYSIDIANCKDLTSEQSQRQFC